MGIQRRNWVFPLPSTFISSEIGSGEGSVAEKNREPKGSAPVGHQKKLGGISLKTPERGFLSPDGRTKSLKE